MRFDQPDSGEWLRNAVAVLSAVGISGAVPEFIGAFRPSTSQVISPTVGEQMHPYLTSATASGPAFLIPAGDWSSWVLAVGTLLLVWLGLRQWKRDRIRALEEEERRNELDESAQARRVGSALGPVGDELYPIFVHVLNASELPIFEVTASGFIILRNKDEPPGSVTLEWSFDEPVFFIRPGENVPLGYPEKPTSVGGDHLKPHVWGATVYFKDANGIAWERSSPGPPRRVQQD